ncbi:MAG: AraC family transcriptional regulator [Rhodospirillaceae bacterium]|nr:AraC family transcriptional regulator [Rhodospirillaceae bacterium]
MDLIFSTERLAQDKRYAAWRETICDVYVHVDVDTDDPSNYEGFIREAKFGDVTVTDIMLSHQHIARRRRHLARLDKDCYYVQFIQTGNINVLQSGATLSTNPGTGALFCASEPYDLECLGRIRSYYLELPRAAFAARFAKDRVPVSATLSTGRGLGRIAVEFCAMLASQGAPLEAPVRARLGEELMDVLALAFDAAQNDEPLAERAVREARLRCVKAWIEDHLCDPDLTLEAVARANGISLRYLHSLFTLEGTSVSHWIWSRRLERSYDMLLNGSGSGRSLTEIAYRVGFNSSSHFSTAFRRKFGLRPSDVRRANSS